MKKSMEEFQTSLQRIQMEPGLSVTRLAELLARTEKDESAMHRARVEAGNMLSLKQELEEALGSEVRIVITKIM